MLNEKEAGGELIESNDHVLIPEIINLPFKAIGMCQLQL
jgi:hypothetical protein